MDAVTFLRNRILAPTSRYFWVIEGDKQLGKSNAVF